VPVSPNEVARRSYLCGLKGHNGLPNKMVICDLETSINNHTSDAVFRVWAHTGFPDEQQDIAAQLEMNTRSKMKIDCFNKMMHDDVWLPPNDDNHDEGESFA